MNNNNNNQFSLPKAKIVCDSINRFGNRLVTMEVKFHRFILAEVNTHRMFCLDGDTEIYFDLPSASALGTKSIFKMKLSDVYKKWTTEINHQPQKEKLKKLNLRQLNEDNEKFQYTHIKNVVFSGIKNVFKVTTSQGTFVNGSKDHRILTQNGWKTIENLIVGKDKLAGTPLKLRWETVVAVELIGERETYDIEVDSDFENFVANGLVVHNSRNSASSRAIPVKKQLEFVKNDPAMPLFWGKNQAGMSASIELEDGQKNIAIHKWLKQRDQTVNTVEELLELGLHKQLTNRLLEPWLWHTAIISATEWSNFFGQRCAINPETNQPFAQPEMFAVACLMRDAFFAGTPTLLQFNEWHLPYITDEDRSNFGIEDLKKISAGRCARVSYLNHDGKRDPIEDIKLADKLLSAKPMHPSPLESVATPFDPYLQNCVESSETKLKGNFVGWKQFRHSFVNENITEYSVAL